jgi:ribonuclease HII
MRSRPDPLLEQHFWQRGISPVAGVDETGVGAWAGPVIAAAVMLPCKFSLPGLNDSKLLSARRRVALFEAIQEYVVAVEEDGWRSPK